MLSKYRSWYNQDAPRPTGFEHDGRPLTRPLEVPDFVNLNPQERVVENFAGRAHAVKAIRLQSRLAVLRDRIITFAYGREQALLTPKHLTMDSRGRLIVADPLAPAVHILDGNSSFRIQGGERRHLQKPGGVAVDAADNIYVVDSGRGVVEVYDPQGGFLRDIGRIDDETLFDGPTSIAIDRDHDRIYLLDTPRNVMLILNLEGHILKRVGRRGTDEAAVEFRYPTAIAIGNAEVMVLDGSGARIQVFNLDGRPLRQFSTHTWTGVIGAPTMESEMSLGADREGNIYLSNFRDSSVSVFAPDGKILSSFGKQGPREGQLHSPTGLYVQDQQLVIAGVNRRVAVFKISLQVSETNKLLPAGK
jgi:sugar lactone lactonase YvrE